MGTYKLVALDMDGTLLDHDQKISEQNTAWIEKAAKAGIYICLSTGRGFQSAVPYAEQLKLETPMVTVNGSEVWTKPYSLYKRTLMETDMIKHLRDIAIQYGSWYWAYAVQGLYNKDQWTDDVDAKEWLKFGYYTEDNEARAKIMEHVSGMGIFEITNSHPTNIELNPKGISKASGLKTVCELLGLDMSQVVAVGDSLNDIAMIQQAGFGVAMGNAQEEVKRVADAVVSSNSEDGVAQVIREFVLA